MRIDLDFEGETPDGWTVLEAVIVAKCLDQDGHVALLNRATPGLSSWEAIGMLICTEDILRDAMASDHDE